MEQKISTVYGKHDSLAVYKFWSWKTPFWEPAGEAAVAADPVKNADCYAQLVNALDDKSLSLTSRHDAADDGRNALKLLREHYSGKSKPRILNLQETKWGMVTISFLF